MASSIVITTPKDSSSSAITTTTTAAAAAAAAASAAADISSNPVEVSSSPPLIRHLNSVTSSGTPKPVIVQVKIETSNSAATKISANSDPSGSTVSKSVVSPTTISSSSVTTSSSSGITVERRNNCCVISIPRSAVKTVSSSSGGAGLATSAPVSTIRVAAAKRLSDSAGFGSQVRALVAAQEGFAAATSSPTKDRLQHSNQQNQSDSNLEPLSIHDALQSALLLLPAGTRKRFQCRLCGNCYARLEYLSRHVRQAHLRDSRLLSLSRQKTGEDVVQVDIDDVDDEAEEEAVGIVEHPDSSAGSPKKQQRRLKTLNNSSGPRCTLCDRRFVDEAELRRHLLSHPGSYECMHCGRWFPSLSGLKRHANDAHQSASMDEEEIYDENDASDDDDLDEDEAGTDQFGNSPASSFSRPCVCAVCQSTFTESHLLANHVKSVHRLRKTGGRGDRRCYQCAYCAKCFHQHTNLRRHLTCHTGQRQFPCPICQKRFADKGDVNKHMVTHTGVKPFKCQVCDRRFGQRTNLRTHALTHATPNEQLIAMGLSPTAIIAGSSASPGRSVGRPRKHQQLHQQQRRARSLQQRSVPTALIVEDFETRQLRDGFFETVEVPEADEEVILG